MVSDPGKMRRLTGRVLSGRWFMVFASILIMAGSGAMYLFAIFSGNIKSSLGYDQSTLNLLSFSKDLGISIGIHAGLINEVTPPWVILSMAAALNFSGFFMIWLSVAKKISRPKVWQMCLYIFIGANSTAFSNTGTVVTNVKNFPESRGAVLGLLKGFTGLGGAILTQIYHAVYGDDSESLILLLGWLPVVVFVAFLPHIRIMKGITRHPRELKVFYQFLYISLGIAGLLMILLIVQKQVIFSQAEYGGGVAALLILLFLPLAVVIKEEFYTWRGRRDTIGQQTQLTIVTEMPNPELELASVPQPPPPPPPPAQEHVSCFKSVFQPPERGEDFTILQALFSVDMLILFITTLCGTGGMLATMDNMGQLGRSLGYPKRSISTFVSLIGIWNYLGRVVAGFVSEIVLAKYKFSRPLMLTLVNVLTCLGHLLIAFNVPYGLYFASIIIGFGFGAQFPLLLATISEIFGLKYYSTLFNFGALASPLGSYIMNVRVTGYLYDKEGERQMKALGLTRKVREELNCVGQKCFELAFIIIAVVTAFGALVSVILVFRTRKFYRSDIYKKFREATKAAEAEMEAVKGIGVVAVAPTLEERRAAEEAKSTKKGIDGNYGIMEST